jgi:hypothetical protein
LDWVGTIPDNTAVLLADMSDALVDMDPLRIVVVVAVVVGGAEDIRTDPWSYSVVLDAARFVVVIVLVAAAAAAAADESVVDCMMELPCFHKNYCCRCCCTLGRPLAWPTLVVDSMIAIVFFVLPPLSMMESVVVAVVVVVMSVDIAGVAVEVLAASSKLPVLSNGI